MKLHVCLKPKPDELLYGWMLRLMDANGCKSLGEMRMRFFENGVYASDSNIKYAKQRPDIICGIEKMCKEHEEVLAFPVVQEIMRQMLPFYGVFPFLTYGYQARWTQFLLLGREEFGDSKLSFLFDEFRICPACMKEDLERYGFSILHTWHQMPGVHVCAVHGDILCHVKAKCRKDAERDIFKNAEPMKLRAPLKTEMQISVFMKELYEEPVFTDLRRLQLMLSDRMEELGIKNAKPYEGLMEAVERSGFEAFMPENCETVVSNYLKGTLQNLENISLFTAFLFQDVKRFREYAESYDVSFQSVFHKLIKDRYEMVSGFEQVVKLKCRMCSHIFYTHPYALFLGVECPNCIRDLTDEQKINRRLSFLGNGEYELAEDFFETGTGQTKVLHRTCGKFRKRRLSDLIWMEKRCQCECMVSEDDIRSVTEINDFEYVRTIRGNDTRIYTLRHKGCGKEFQIDRRQFVRNPVCPYCTCRNTKKYDDISFAEEVKALTGDEYAVEEAYKGKYRKIGFKHHVCGTITELTPEAFLNGQRCRLCREFYTEAEMEKMVGECTGGAYQTGEFRNSYYTIRDPDGKIHRKKACYILQELKRPTGSPLFKIRVRYPEEKVSLRQILYLKAKEEAGADKIWIYKKGCIRGFSVSGEARALRTLVKKGYLEHVGYGKYRITGSE